ncbi:folate synthesis bifunctional protein, mitochondrial-like [Iris pallida]|uniref:Folate synthesis bifunctional protein, mitochondrial-like n=1 Tax=Iris pallida TaxID=29817 RepID=A0AAX6H401_IRIPA|nr:folate synthesis bifunctional protein, mitochondrial-like [Iris pallida]KAJ6848984.1 folate synthesis bifunctional protein, mitochondrial-like [Iris pallida]
MYRSGVLETTPGFSSMEMFKKLSPLVKHGVHKFTNSSTYRRLSLRAPLSASNHAIRRSSLLHSSAEFVHTLEEEVVIALGSNVGNRIQNFNEALRLMKKSGINVTRHGCLYETEPAYVTDQPLFLNSAIRGTTKLRPHELLKVLKHIERELDRTDGIRYGPRPIDLDILFYGRLKVESESLTIPHERIWERPFVVAPLVDLLGSSIDNGTEQSWHSLSRHSGGLFEVWQKLGGESLIGREGMRRVLPLGGSLWDWSKRTHVMGVLNLTPDSFSDGGKFLDVDAAVSQARLLISEGADIIDIGAQSTRPFAHRVSVDEELERLVPVLDALLQLPEVEGKLLSVDTFYAEVASEAVKKGVHIVNDVSGGQLDPKILSAVGDLGVPYITMHMRGDPCTMQNDQNLQYDDVCKQVASELYSRLNEAELAGIPAWRIILDPGIGFSKKNEHNLEILMGLESIRRELGKKSVAASHAPILVGPSRKKFLGEICNRSNPVERDPATIAAITTGVLGGANIIRVHNISDNLDAAKVCDALLKQRKGNVVSS